MISEKTSAFNPAKVASEHAGRELVAGCGPWIREKDEFYLSIEDNKMNEQEGWQWISIHRPDLANRFSSLREMHEALAHSRWLNISNDLGLVVEVIREEGQFSGYTYDWETVEILREEISDNGEEEGEFIQELQLRSPSGSVLHVEARRVIRYRRNSYPGGNYQIVVDL